MSLLVTDGFGYESVNPEASGGTIDVGIITSDLIAIATTVDDINISIAIDENDEVTIEVT